jgi:hypothetical protein
VPLQAKLRISEPNDRFEREADAVADHVMQMPESDVHRRRDSGCSSCNRRRDEEVQTASLQRQEEEEEAAQTSSLQRQEEEEEAAQTSSLQRQEEEEEEAQTSSLQRQEEEEEEAQTKAAPRGHARVTPRFESRLKALKAGGGRPIDAPVRTLMEARFGRSFENVRVHTDGTAAALARQAKARAFTVGRHLVFNSGQYRPNADQGRRLIAHELTHVLQQRGGLHSVQREIQPETAAAPKQADSALLEELRDLFRLRTPTAPPSILSIAVDLLPGQSRRSDRRLHAGRSHRRRDEAHSRINGLPSGTHRRAKRSGNRNELEADAQRHRRIIHVVVATRVLPGRPAAHTARRPNAVAARRDPPDLL